MTLTHFDQKGMPQMVEVSQKESSHREALACGEIVMGKAAFEHLVNRTASKGDVLTIADLAGIMGAKMTSQLIPLCHPLSLTGVNLWFDTQSENRSLVIYASVKTFGATGVEMEALTAVSVAALTVYDMLKAADKAMVISNIRLLEKTGGKSGQFKRGETDER